ncbi:MAG TPA: FtsQ-type POTRA domain-containing protein [Gaiellaceae bacterium]|nr:FtsQ-type POTRA domain-containing protein [Gaiellaceae bacterium]
MAARRRALVIAIALPVVLTGAYFAARETSTFSVRTIAVSGGTPALQARVRAALAPVVGTSLLALNGAAVERRVDALPAVLSSRYDRAFPHTLRVTVVSEAAVAVLHKGKETWLVSARGRTIERIPAGTDLVLPRIWVPTATQIAPGSFLAPDEGGTAAHVLGLAAGFPARFTTVSVAHGEVTLRLRLGIDLRLGEPVDVRLKLAVARRALRVLPPGSTYLDVAVPQRPVAGANPQVSSTGSIFGG